MRGQAHGNSPNMGDLVVEKDVSDIVFDQDLSQIILYSYHYEASHFLKIKQGPSGVLDLIPARSLMGPLLEEISIYYPAILGEFYLFILKVKFNSIVQK